MKHLFVLFAFVLLVLSMKDKEENITRSVITRVDVFSEYTVSEKFTLFVPTSMKFESPLVNENEEGKILLYVGDTKFCYKRSFEYNRNEYFLDSSCGKVMDEIEVSVGTTINTVFSDSNMWKAENVPLFGFKQVLVEKKK